MIINEYNETLFNESMNELDKPFTYRLNEETFFYQLDLPKPIDIYENNKYSSETNYISNNINNSNPFDGKDEESFNYFLKFEDIIKEDNKDDKDDNKKEETKLLNKKVKREKEKEKEVVININNKENNNKKKNTDVNKVKKQLGRKNNNDPVERQHNKTIDDNIINKLKGFYLNTFLRQYIQKHAIDPSIEFKKIPNKFISNLNKDFNMALFPMKISDILNNQIISTKYSTCDDYENREIIKRLNEEKKEIYIIKILDLTFEELLIIFRRKLKDENDMKKLEEIKDKIEGLDLDEKKGKDKDIEYLIKYNEDKHKETKGKKEIEEYNEKIKKLCLTYKQWFEKKTARRKRKEKVKA